MGFVHRTSYIPQLKSNERALIPIEHFERKIDADL